MFLDYSVTYVPGLYPGLFCYLCTRTVPPHSA